MAEKKSSNSRSKNPAPRASAERRKVESIDRNDVQTTQAAEVEANVSRPSGNTSADQAPAISSLNAVIEGNSTIGLDDIRKRAYELYEEDGRLEGRHEDHWRRAEEELRNRRMESASEVSPGKSSGKRRA